MCYYMQLSCTYFIFSSFIQVRVARDLGNTGLFSQTDAQSKE